MISLLKGFAKIYTFFLYACSSIITLYIIAGVVVGVVQLFK